MGHGAGCFHEKSHSFSEKGQRGGVERISQVGKTAVKSEAPALGCKLILLSLKNNCGHVLGTLGWQKSDIEGLIFVEAE